MELITDRIISLLAFSCSEAGDEPLCELKKFGKLSQKRETIKEGRAQHKQSISKFNVEKTSMKREKTRDKTERTHCEESKAARGYNALTLQKTSKETSK